MKIVGEIWESKHGSRIRILTAGYSFIGFRYIESGRVRSIKPEIFYKQFRKCNE